MQHEVSRKRALMPSPAMIVAIIALIAALTGSAYAAKKTLPKNIVGTKQLKAKSVTTGKIANNSVKSTNIIDKSITGHAAACPGGTTLIRGVCFDSSSNGPTSSLLKARDACAAKGGYLPSPLKLWSTKGVLNLGTGVGEDIQYTDTYYDNTEVGKKELEELKEGKTPPNPSPIAPSTIVVDGKGTLTEQSVDDNAEFICAYPLVR